MQKTKSKTTHFEYELYGNYGYGWDYILTEYSREEINERKKEYQENEGIPLKIKRISKEEVL
jgi:hypothetical protein